MDKGRMPKKQRNNALPSFTPTCVSRIHSNFKLNSVWYSSHLLLQKHPNSPLPFQLLDTGGESHEVRKEQRICPLRHENSYRGWLVILILCPQKVLGTIALKGVIKTLEYTSDRGTWRLTCKKADCQRRTGHNSNPGYRQPIEHAQEKPGICKCGRCRGCVNQQVAISLWALLTSPLTSLGKDSFP